MCRLMVMGLGNILLSDEGAGIHLLSELKNHDLPIGTELVDAGTAGMNLLYLMEGVERLVIVDSICTDAEAGAIYRLTLQDIYECPPRLSISFHQISLLDVLSQGIYLGKLPTALVIYGIQPKSLDWGVELSNEVKARLPKLAELVCRELWTLASS